MGFIVPVFSGSVGVHIGVDTGLAAVGRHSSRNWDANKSGDDFAGTK